jgi:hypothetical protein
MLANVDTWINLHALWKIIVIGLLAGAGLPALFAVGLRALAMRPAGATTSASNGAAAATTASDESVYAGNPVGLVIAGVCFLAVLAAIGWGIYSIVAAS